MGISVQGRSGLVGNAPVAVVRLANSAVFRRAIGATPQADSGVIMDDYLYGQYVRQDFRWDMNAAEYLPVRVDEPAKDFTAAAWLRVPGYSPDQLAALIEHVPANPNMLSAPRAADRDAGPGVGPSR